MESMLTLAQPPVCISTLSIFYTSSPQTFQDNDPPLNRVIPYGPSVTSRTEHYVVAPCISLGHSLGTGLHNKSKRQPFKSNTNARTGP